MIAAPAVPTLREELDRKAFQTVDWLFTSLEKGKLTPAQFSTGIDALFMATSGLVDEDIATIITGTNDMAKKGVFKRVLMRRDATCVLTRVAGASNFLMIAYRAGEQMSERIKECDSSQEAARSMEQFAQALIAKGYIEI